jgi:hypothetical protein
MSDYEDDNIEFEIEGFYIYSNIGYVTLITENCLELQNCNGPEGGTTITIFDSSVEINTNGDWGRMKLEHNLDVRKLIRLREEFHRIYRMRNREDEDIKEPEFE